MVRGSVITESGGAGYDDVFLLRQRGQGRLLLQDLRKPSDTGGGQNSENMEGEELTVFELAEEQRVNYQN